MTTPPPPPPGPPPKQRAWHRRKPAQSSFLATLGFFVVVGIIADAAEREDESPDPEQVIGDVTDRSTYDPQDVADELLATMTPDVFRNFCTDIAINGDGWAYQKFEQVFSGNSYGVDESFMREVFDGMAAEC